MVQPEEVLVERIAAVLDANAFIDLCSIHDLSRARPDDIEKREARARDALLLGICFHEIRATTYSLREPVDVLSRLVPANSGGVEEQFLKIFFHFVHPQTLPHWNAGCANVDARGNAADARILHDAKDYGKPLITYDAKLSARARAAGVEVCTPRDFFRERLRPDAEQRFLSRFKRSYPRFRPLKASADHVGQGTTLFIHYRYLLLDRVSLVA